MVKVSEGLIPSIVVVAAFLHLKVSYWDRGWYPVISFWFPVDPVRR